MHIKRHLLDIIAKSTKSILLLGPRQTGKSTLMRELNPDVEINLADEETFIGLLRDPARVKELCADKGTIFIDEVQRIPSLLNTVQFLIDKNRDVKPQRFLLTGSSAQKLRRGHANLLPGRIDSYELGPLTARELEYKVDLKAVLSKGMLPGFLTDCSDGWKKTLRTYSITYLKEEIQAEALTRNLEGFSRFFDVVVSRSGDYMDYTKFASTAQIERTTASRYFDTLVDTLVVDKVEPFTKSRRRQLVQHPKFYLFDVGILNGVLGNFEPSADRIGTLFEHLVNEQITSSLKALDEEARISSYRTDRGVEVDFIIEKGHELTALEVKASKNICESDLRGLDGFRKFYTKPHRSVVACLVETPRKIGSVEILPWVQALQEMGL